MRSPFDEKLSSHRRKYHWSPLIGLFPWLLFAYLSIHLEYTPRGQIYSHEVLPLLLAPWSTPKGPLLFLSRIAQMAALVRIPLDVLPRLYICWMALALVRGAVGYLFTRSVGWAYPWLFRHWALYESSDGFGPMIVAAFALDPDSPPWLLPAFTIVTCWIEGRPWTYGLTLILICGLRLTAWIPRLSAQKIELLPQLSPGKLSLRPGWKPLLLSFFCITPYLFIPAPRRSLPPMTGDLMDIVILSHPRPIPLDTFSTMLSTTLLSFLQHSRADTTLSVFTHSKDHPAFESLALQFPSIKFYVDRDEHPGDADGQYLHLAEAFRWAYETHKGEWLLLVEDDFSVCPGEWPVIETVLHDLERDRKRGVIRSGFIGTGGSGLIIHRSYLRLLILLLRTHSKVDSPLVPQLPRRNPDEIVQDCLLGRRGSLCEQSSETSPQNMIISSRLVLDHIGGMATTDLGKAWNLDKWRCGWRHPFHGAELILVHLAILFITAVYSFDRCVWNTRLQLGFQR